MPSSLRSGARLVLIAAAPCLVATSAHAADPVLVRDLQTTPFQVDLLKGSCTPESVVSNDVLYLSASDDAHGAELWRSDGTAAGTRLVRDISPGPPSSRLAHFAALPNGVVVFEANDGSGDEMWRSDGTTAGTYALRYIRGGSEGTGGRLQVVVAGSQAYFRAGDVDHGAELWVTDGTTAGTHLVQDIYPGTGNSFPQYFAARGSELFFQADDGVNGAELWRTDGTTTVLVADIRAGPLSSIPQLTTVVGNNVFFAANDGTSGQELWMSNGNVGNATRVADIFAGAPGSQPQNLTAGPGYLVFTADDGSRGREPWASNGTANGTFLLLDTISGGGSATVASFTNFADKVWFSGYEPNTGTELYRTDGTAPGTVRAFDYVSGGQSFSPFGFGNRAVVGGELWFRATTPTTGEELFASDGTLEGTRLIADLLPGTGTTSLGYFRVIGSRMIFCANYPAAPDIEPWITDGTPEGTSQILDIYPSPTSSSPTYVSALGDRVVFQARTEDVGRELWASDGTVNGTVLLADARAGTDDGDASRLVIAGTKAYFGARDDQGYYRLWASDGTPSGTARVSDVQYADEAGAASGGVLYFSGDDDVHGRELWRSDGTPAGTFMVADINQSSAGGGGGVFCAEEYGLPPEVCCQFVPQFCAQPEAMQCQQAFGIPSFACCEVTQMCGQGGGAGTAGSYPDELLDMGSYILFGADDGEHGRELWRSDGTPEGTTLVVDAYPGSDGFSPLGDLARAGDLAYFVGSNGAGWRVWRTDGTPGGPYVPQPIGGVDPLFLTAVGDVVYYSGYNEGSLDNRELWRTDGTPAGSYLVRELAPGADGSNPRALHAVGGRLVFVAAPGEGGLRLFVSDGTAQGTVPLGPADLRMPDVEATAFGRIDADTLVFAAATLDHGLELWRTDGTDAGTVLVADILSGPGSSSPADLALADGTLFFSASGTSGNRELWSMPWVETPCTPCDANEYEVTGCTAAADRVCAPCSICEAGEYTANACSEAGDTDCQPCASCASDEWAEGGCDGVVDTVCQSCSTCSGGEFAASPCSAQDDTVCEDCRACQPGYYPDGGCTGAVDTICTPCPVGTDGDGTRCDVADDCSAADAICGVDGAGGRILWGVLDFGTHLEAFRCVVPAAGQAPRCDTEPGGTVLTRYPPMCGP